MPSSCPAGQFLTQITATTYTCTPQALPGSGSITDSMLANPYGGVGACPAGQYEITDIRNAAPACAQVNFNQLAGSAIDSQLVSAYSGVGTCTAGQFVSGLTRGSAPTCTTPATATGTVTSISAGTGITVSPSPITASGSVSLTTPVSVANGGRGSSTALVAGQIDIAQSATALAGVAMSGDATITSAGVITVTKSNGTALTSLFAPLTNPTNGQNNYAPLASPIFTGTVTMPRGFSCSTQSNPFTLGIGASRALMSVGSYGAPSGGLLNVTANFSGAVTNKLYAITMMGSGNTGIAQLGSSDYGGGAAPFTVTETVNSPTGGSNQLFMNNTSGTAFASAYYSFLQIGGAIVTCY
jgi:hypothetical protein